MLQQIQHLGEAPGGQLVLRRKEAADTPPKVLEGEKHQDQGEEKIRCGETDETEEGEDVVGEGILMGG